MSAAAAVDCDADGRDAMAVTLEVEEPSRTTVAGARSEVRSSDPRVPTTAVAVAQWVQTWMQMCADGDLVSGPLIDEERARTVYNPSCQKLHNIRSAVVSGALALRAAELEVELAAELTASVPASINGRQLDGIAT
jgi:hypothetical protein